MFHPNNNPINTLLLNYLEINNNIHEFIFIYGAITSISYNSSML